VNTTATTARRSEPGTGPETLIQEARRRQRRRWLMTGVTIAVVAACMATVIAGSGTGSGARPPGSHRLPGSAHGQPAAAAHASAALVTVSQTSFPSGNSLSLAIGYRSVWVTGVSVTYQVNQATGRIMRTISTPGTFPDGCRSGIAAGAGAVWVTHSCRGVYRISPDTGRVTASVRIPKAGSAIAVAGGLVWVTTYSGDLLRIQPQTSKITGKPIHVGLGDWAMVPATGALWVTSYGSGGPPWRVSRVNLATGAVQQLGNLDVEAAGGGSLWTPQVQRIDPATGSVIASVPVPATAIDPGVAQVTFWNGSAWELTVQRSLTLLRIDPATSHVIGQPVPVGRPLPSADEWGAEPSAIAAGPAGIWVLDFYRNLLFHLTIRSPRP
jgi:hypothetical protein